MMIKKLLKKRWKDYKKLRLDALRNEPQAFGSSYEEEVKLTKTEWTKRIDNALFAVINDKPVGMIVYFFNTKQKTSHIAHIFGFYVAKQHRRLGIGSKLFETAISTIKRNRHIRKIQLMVNPRQIAAIKIYEIQGFVKTGLLKRELMVKCKFHDELVMEKLLE